MSIHALIALVFFLGRRTQVRNNIIVGVTIYVIYNFRKKPMMQKKDDPM